MLSPDWRVTVPTVGSIAPVISLNSVVLPVPFRPTIPQRSPELTVKVMSRNKVVAPKSTPAPPTDICVMSCAPLPTDASWGDEPALPDVLRCPDGQRVPVTNERHLQQERLIRENGEPSFIAVPRGAEPELSEASRAFVYQGLHPELLREAHQLAP